jgi:hypothetical protein
MHALAEGPQFGISVAWAFGDLTEHLAGWLSTAF